ncbi:DUF6781 family protein [Sulfurimonas sp. C5]|uniref:DUF6781 family protein n=1 Tax=Sulfurimonas sp. C5 TaxID=3036947 RepID=UPI002454CE49|nr:DUF6781 family protein [Sulfurimonas sp. C5]MDH4944272.1 hypothetical protein [Sulfurimonas sp. C5]
MATNTLEKKVDELFKNLDPASLELQKIETISTGLVQTEISSIEEELENLLEKKEELERAIEKKSEAIQEKKYEVFNALEAKLQNYPESYARLHQIKLQSIDLYEILSEIVESAIITALEKERDSEFKEYLIETIKEITFESIKEGPLNTIRIRKILSTILGIAIEIAEAEPNKAEDILTATTKGMRSGLIKSIHRFKKRLVYMPVEAKHILIEDYDTIMEDLNQTDTIFSQVIINQASQSSSVVHKILLDLNKEMKYDLEELLLVSKETAEVMKNRFANFAKIAVKKADSAIHSPKAQEAKRIGKQAFETAKIALGSAIKTAKDVIDKNKS